MEQGIRIEKCRHTLSEWTARRRNYLTADIKAHQARRSSERKIICTWKTLKTGADLQQPTTEPHGQIVKSSQKASRSLNPSAGMFTLQVMLA